MNNMRQHNSIQEMNLNTADSVQALAVSSTVVAPAAAFADSTTHVLLNVAAADVRVTVDGSDPVGGATGQLWLNGTTMLLNKKLVARLKFIRNAAINLVVTMWPVNAG